MTSLKHTRGHYCTNKSLLISNLQKCIRRSCVKPALKTALALIEHHPVDFIRRLPIIIMEDIILHPHFDHLVELMVKASGKHVVFTNREVDFILSTIRDLTQCKYRDMVDPIILAQFKKSNLDKKLSTETSCHINALRTRAKYGGMKCDMEMLEDYAAIWTVRFQSNEEYWLEFLNEQCPNTKSIDSGSIGTLKKEDILLEAVDFHCSPIIHILLKKGAVISHVYRMFGGSMSIRTILTDLIWHLRSNQNPRKVFYDKKIPVDSINLYYDEASIKRFVKLYYLIEEDLEGISNWWIEKQHEAENKPVQLTLE